MRLGNVKHRLGTSFRVRLEGELQNVDAADTIAYSIKFVLDVVEGTLVSKKTFFEYVGGQSEEFLRGYQAAIEDVRKAGTAQDHEPVARHALSLAKEKDS